MVFLCRKLLIKASSVRIELGSLCRESAEWLEMYLRRPESSISPQHKQTLLRWMIGSSTFDQFLTSKFPSAGYRETSCEMLIPAIKALLTQANSLGVTSFVMGIKSSQSSLNILGSGLYVPVLPMIASKLKVTEGLKEPIDNVVLLVRNQLDSIAHAIVCGKTLAEQGNQHDYLHRQVWTVIVNTDDPLDNCGGSIETSRVSNDKNLTVGGIIHLLVTNEKIGISWLCRPLAFLDPVVHVDANDPEAVIYVMETVALFKHLFQRDIFVNLENFQEPCHNKSDIAAIFDQLELRKPILKELSEQLIEEKLTTPTDIVETVSQYKNWFIEQYELAEKEVNGISNWFRDKLFFATNLLPSREECIGENRSEIKEREFEALIQYVVQGWVHESCQREIKQILLKRFELAKEGKITWNMAEMLAIAYLLKRNVSVRISGSDVNCNFYSERHYLLWDTETNDTIIPFSEMFDNDAKFTLCETKSLSADAGLAYELGVSQSNQKSITVWESTTSEFSSLQYTLDRFVSRSGQWYRRSNLVILLPHDPTVSGLYSKPSRILDLCHLNGTPNWTVANVSSPANYFHLLLKQVNSHTPLVIFSHRTLMKDDSTVSFKKEFIQNEFQCYFSEEKECGRDLVRVLVCTGRIYHELMEAREARSLTSLVAISRIEQLYPFPSKEVTTDISRFRHASVFWVQEEPGYRGWWDWVAPNMKEALRNIKFDLYLIKPPRDQTMGRLPSPRISVINTALSVH